MNQVLIWFGNTVAKTIDFFRPARQANAAWQYDLVRELILNCIDEDITNPIPKQLLNIKAQTPLEAFFYLYMAISLLILIEHDYEEAGYEIDARWHSALNTAHEYLLHKATEALSSRERTLFRKGLAPVYSACMVAFDSKYYEPLFETNFGEDPEDK